MEALRSISSAAVAVAEKAGKDEKPAQEGGSFFEMLEGIQKEDASAIEGEKTAPAEGAAKAEKENVALVGGAKIPKAEGEEAELVAAIGVESPLLLQVAESPKVFSIDIDIDIDAAGDAEKEAEANLDAAPALSALEAEEEDAFAAALAKERPFEAEEEDAFVATLAKEQPLKAEAGEDADADANAALHEDIKPLKREVADTPESLNASIAEAEGEKAAEEGQEKAFISVRDLRAGERFARDSRVVDAPAAQDASNSSSADIEMRLHFNADAALEGEGLAGKEGGSSWQAGGFSLEGARLAEGAPSAAQGAAGASFAERLAEQLRSSAADIVRAGQIVLKDGGEGTIRLALHPETLGAVRIRLEMSGEKRISGKITVSSREAWDAFSESMDSLVAALADEGFETAAGFDLSWAGRGGEADGGKVSAPFYASSIPDVMHDGDFSDDYSISAARRSALYAVDIFA